MSSSSDETSSDDSFFESSRWPTAATEEDSEDTDSMFSSDTLINEVVEDEESRVIPNRASIIGYSFFFKQYRHSNIQHLLIHRLSPTTFYSYPTERLEEYLDYYRVEWNYHYAPDAPHIRILQIEHVYTKHSPEPEYLLIDKTFWLRLVQRVWKRKCKEKKRRQCARGTLHNQRHIELYGKYLPGYNYLSLLPLF